MMPLPRILLLCTAIGCMALLHVYIHHDTASLFLAPVGISILLASINPAPMVLILIVALFFELISTLPFGTIFILFAIPFIIQWIVRLSVTGISWKFFFITLFSTIFEIIFFVIAKTIFHPLSIYAIPFGIVSMQIVCTGLMTFFIAALYHEYSSRV